MRSAPASCSLAQILLKPASRSQCTIFFDFRCQKSVVDTAHAYIQVRKFVNARSSGTLFFQGLIGLRIASYELLMCNDIRQMDPSYLPVSIMDRLLVLLVPKIASASFGKLPSTSRDDFCYVKAAVLR